MLIAHLADLHLGYRAYHRMAPGGVNQRERDVAEAAGRVVDRIVAERPDLVLVAGDVFHTVRPSNSAIMDGFRLFMRLRRGLPDTPVVMIAGNHDSPRSVDTGSILRLLGEIQGVHVVDDGVRTVELESPGASVLCVPHAALMADDPPGLQPDPGAAVNILMTHGTVSGTGVDEQLMRLVEYGGAHLERGALREDDFDYVALGHYHNATRIAANVWYAGATERTATNIWAEAETRKGFVLFDTETREGEFVDIATREVVDLPRFTARRRGAAGPSAPGFTAPGNGGDPSGDGSDGSDVGDVGDVGDGGDGGVASDEWLTPEEVDARIDAAVSEVPGGVEGKVVRLVITDIPRELFRALDHRRIRALKAEALHFQLDARRPESRRRSAVGEEGRRLTLEEELVAFLSEWEPETPGVDPARLRELGLRYLADTQDWRDVLELELEDFGDGSRAGSREGGDDASGGPASTAPPTATADPSTSPNTYEYRYEPESGVAGGPITWRCPVKLNRLRLLNFRQHADTEIDFRSGVTGIIGPNGAGKSTLLEAIAWAIYGASAARGTNDTIRFARAAPRSPVRVELDFGLAGHEYRVQRTMSSADVWVDGDQAPAASTIRGATDYLQQRLGMTRDEFFNTYFTGQKELQFLAQMGPTDRGRFLAQVLGYERLRMAQERARARRNDLRHEIEGLRTGMADAATLRAELNAARERQKEATAAAGEAAAALEAATKALESVSPRWEAAQRAQERAGELEHQREMAAQEFREAAREASRAEEELAAVTAAESELASLREELAPLPELVAECDRLSELARLDERRRVLTDTVEQARSEIGDGERRLEALAQAPGYVERFTAELATLRAELEETESALEKARDLWQQDQQEVRTRLVTYKDRTAELQQQLDQLRDAGPEGICPTCDRPLHDHYDQVMRTLEDEWESLVQDGKWLKQRESQLAPKPQAVEEAERRRAELRSRIENRAEKLKRSEVAVEERDKLTAELASRRERLAKQEAELAEIPGGYDRGTHQAAEKRLESLREVERRATRLEETASRKERLSRDLAEATERRTAAEAKGTRVREELEALSFDPDAFAATKTEQEGAAEAVRSAELRLTEARSRAEAAGEAVERAEKAESDLAGKKRALDGLETDRRHNAELDVAFNQLRVELNARVRPELSDLASAFLSDITGGRYTALEIDENYNVLVLEEGEEKPVISGGEEDIANLVLRLAISQMIAERAGHPLSVLILDEVFGSLDVERRDNVIQLLHGLTGRFEQVILITHIEGIRDGLENVVRCTFDERTGASRVVQEDAGLVVARELAGV